AGSAYGGDMGYRLAGHTNRFKALVDHDGVFDPASMAGSTEELWFTDWEFGGPLYSNRALYEQWSPLSFVSNWKTPILIIHSQLDYRVDLSEGYQAFTAAKRMGLDALTGAFSFTYVGQLVEVLLLKIPGIGTSSGKVVRVLGWFAGGLWCYVLARWALLAYGRDVRQLPSLIWGGLFFVALQFVVHGILQATGKPNFYSGQLPESETTVA